MGIGSRLWTWLKTASRSSRSDHDFQDDFHRGSGTRLTIGSWSIGLGSGEGDRDLDGVPDSRDPDPDPGAFGPEDSDSGDSDSGDSDGGSDD